MSKPTPLAVTLAALPNPYGLLRGSLSGRQGWMYADQIHANLRRLGFEVTSHQVTATLRQDESLRRPVDRDAT